MQLIFNDQAITLSVHVSPSPLYPTLHVHEKLPLVFAQVASSWQLSVSVAHSLISKGIQNMCF